MAASEASELSDQTIELLFFVKGSKASGPPVKKN
jgi:hypothetical protein